MKAQRERFPIDIAGRSGGQAPAGERKCQALQQKGKGQHRGGKRPPHARQPMQPPDHGQSSGAAS
jgi:hypothetical protein